MKSPATHSGRRSKLLAVIVTAVAASLAAAGTASAATAEVDPLTGTLVIVGGADDEITQVSHILGEWG